MTPVTSPIHANSLALSIAQARHPLLQLLVVNCTATPAVSMIPLLCGRRVIASRFGTCCIRRVLETDPYRAMAPIDPMADMPLANSVIRCEADKPRREATNAKYPAAH